MHYHLIGMNKNATWFVINLLNEGLQHSTSPEQNTFLGLKTKDKLWWLYLQLQAWFYLPFEMKEKTSDWI